MSRINDELSKKLGEQLEIKKEENEIAVSKLKLDRDRVRKKENPEEREALAKNIKIYGQIEPLIINQNKEVIHGTRRFNSMKLAGIGTASIVLYRLKDSSMQDEVLNFIIKNKMNADQASKLVAEMNNPELAVEHIKSYIKRTINGINLIRKRKNFLKLGRKYRTTINRDFNDIIKLKEKMFGELGWQ